MARSVQTWSCMTGGVCGEGEGGGAEGKPSLLRMKERLVILVGFYPTRSARFLIARGAGCERGVGCVRGEEAWTACVVDVQAGA